MAVESAEVTLVTIAMALEALHGIASSCRSQEMQVLSQNGYGLEQEKCMSDKYILHITCVYTYVYMCNYIYTCACIYMCWSKKIEEYLCI